MVYSGICLRRFHAQVAVTLAFAVQDEEVSWLLQQFVILRLLLLPYKAL